MLVYVSQIQFSLISEGTFGSLDYTVVYKYLNFARFSKG
jgi:hypothetical protein